MALVTIKTFDNSIDAHMLRSRLESEGIGCYLFDENVVSLNPLYNVTVGGIKLKINDFDVEKAQIIINEVEQAPILNDKNEVLRCKNCGSSDLISGYKSMKSAKGILSAILSFLLMIYPIYFKTVYKCKACGAEFKK